MAPATFDYFFDLPGELREQILARLLIKAEGIHINTSNKLDLIREASPERRTQSQPHIPSDDEDGDGDDDDDDDDDDGRAQQEGGTRFGWPLDYFLVSQTFHREASAIFFAENVFHLYTRFRLSRDLGSFPSRQGPAAWTRRGGPQQHNGGNDRYCGGGGGSGSGSGEYQYKHFESLRRVRRAVLHAHRLGGVLGSHFVPVLGGMVLSGGLKHLDVRLYLSPEQGAKGPAGAWGSGPGRGVLGLLRDPDLDSARLSVCLDAGRGEAREVAPWCPRRERVGGDLVTGRDGEGRVWFEVDVWELVRRYGGGEVGIFKVGEGKSLLRWAGAGA